MGKGKKLIKSQIWKGWKREHSGLPCCFQKKPRSAPGGLHRAPSTPECPHSHPSTSPDLPTGPLPPHWGLEPRGEENLISILTSWPHRPTNQAHSTGTPELKQARETALLFLKNNQERRFHKITRSEKPFKAMCYTTKLSDQER